MVDVVPRNKRSQMMAGIKGKNTKPEILIRKELFKLGYRYRINSNRLPGKPDIVLPKYNAIIFIHGCFWHHHDCKLFKWPKSNSQFWKNKILANVERDNIQIRKLLGMGWKVLLVWECSIKGKNENEISNVVLKITKWLNGDSYNIEISERGINELKSRNV